MSYPTFAEFDLTVDINMTFRSYDICVNACTSRVIRVTYLALEQFRGSDLDIRITRISQTFPNAGTLSIVWCDYSNVSILCNRERSGAIFSGQAVHGPKGLVSSARSSSTYSAMREISSLLKYEGLPCLASAPSMPWKRIGKPIVAKIGDSRKLLMMAGGPQAWSSPR